MRVHIESLTDNGKANEGKHDYANECSDAM